MVRGCDASKLTLAGDQHGTVEEIRAYVGADSLGYLSLDGMVTAAGEPKEAYCRACFDGEYPIDVPAQAGKFVLEDQLRLPTG